VIGEPPSSSGAVQLSSANVGPYSVTETSFGGDGLSRTNSWQLEH